MACFTSAKLSNLLPVSALLLVMVCIAATVVSAAFQFDVGGAKGWAKPTGKEEETYNEWATRNRFHVGDFVYFKYQNDSVLVVSREDYEECNVKKPVSKFEDGSTAFRFDRYGFFYFISGKPGHCKSGQKLVIRVMVHPEVEPPGLAPAPHAGGGGDGGGGDEWGPPTPNSTVRLPVESYFMTALGGMLVILYLLM